MDDVEIAIRLQNVSKNFSLPSEKYTSLKSHVIHPFKRRSFSAQHALKNIDLEIKKGEFFGIVGRNGSGKSTLLKILAGIYQPTKGQVKTVGKLVPFIELGVGFNPELTGRDNIFLNGAILGFSQKEVTAMYDDIVEFAELAQHMDQKLKNYSSGMQVRLAFSMAVRAKADILLIDEVLAVGDADFQRKCFDYFKKLKKDKVTVIFVSHNMDAIREYCDRAMLIEDSRIVGIGSTSTIAEKYLRMFTENASSSQLIASEQRWGDQAVKIMDIAVSVSDSKIAIHETLKANKDIDNPIIGFRIRDAAGKDVTGTNNKVEQKTLGSFTKGQVIKITWQIPNLLSDGEYVVDPAVLHEDGITACDWWNEATKIIIKKNRHLPYIIDPGFELKVDVSK